MTDKPAAERHRDMAREGESKSNCGAGDTAALRSPVSPFSHDRNYAELRRRRIEAALRASGLKR